MGTWRLPQGRELGTVLCLLVPRKVSALTELHESSICSIQQSQHPLVVILERMTRARHACRVLSCVAQDLIVSLYQSDIGVLTVVY